MNGNILFPETEPYSTGYLKVSDIHSMHFEEAGNPQGGASQIFPDEWERWEASTMTLVPDPEALDEMSDGKTALSIGRIECHYTYNYFFMKTGNYLLENIDRISHIPCRIVQGRHDIICPMISAWELHKALPQSELRIVPDGAHSPMDSGMISELVQSTEDFREL